MKTKKLNLILFIMAIFTIISCSVGDLSRNKAHELIVPIVSHETLLISVETETDHFEWEVPCRELERYTSIDRLVQKGYISLRDKQYVGKMAVFTQKLKPYVLDPNRSWGIRIIVGTMSDIKITGISGDDTRKIVDFEILYTLNELGKDISYNQALSKQRSIIFKKYDDGWRIEQ